MKTIDVQLGLQREQLGNQLEAVFVAQAKIEKGRVEAALLQLAQRFRAVLGLHAFVPERVERHRRGFANVGFVVDDQDAHVENHRSHASGKGRGQNERLRVNDHVHGRGGGREPVAPFAGPAGRFGLGWTAVGFAAGESSKRDRRGRSRPVDLHHADIDLNALKRIRGPWKEPAMGAAFSGSRETATVTCCAPVMMPEVGIEALPARAGQINFRPGMGGSAARFGRLALHVAADEPRGQSPAAAGLQQQRGEIAAGAAVFLQRFRRGLHARFIAPLVLKGLIDVRVHILQQGDGFDLVARLPELAQPFPQRGGVLRINDGP